MFLIRTHAKEIVMDQREAGNVFSCGKSVGGRKIIHHSKHPDFEIYQYRQMKTAQLQPRYGSDIHFYSDMAIVKIVSFAFRITSTYLSIKINFR